MECKNVESLLSQFIENDVSKEIHKEISLHIKQCSNCKQLKEKIENLMYLFPELEEDVPFFLKNRVYYLPETQETKQRKFFNLKWVAASVGTLILFLNLFYFTNVFPPANRILHSIVSDIEKLAVETEAFIEKIKESKDLFALSEDETTSEEEPEDNNGESVKSNNEKT